MFRDVITSETCPPVLIRGVIDSWPAMQWTPHYLSTALQGHKFQCKVSSTSPDEMLWETDCLHLVLSLDQYCDWLMDKPASDNPLQHFDKGKYSCYVDYKYMNEMFAHRPELLDAVKWDVCGCQGRDGRDSTIWIGSTRAYTPCHQDTYGFNLVAQLHGRKRWYLFPPDQSQCMYPTRIPYEESSVFSEVNVRVPDLDRHPNFKGATPYIVELSPGDVLYVPRHWWHFVECLDSSISVNTWIPREADTISRLHESISRLLFTTLTPVLLGSDPQQEWINTNEELQSVDTSLQYLRTTVQNVLEMKQKYKSVQQASELKSTNVTQEPHNRNTEIIQKSHKKAIGHSACGDSIFNDFVTVFGDFEVKPLNQYVLNSKVSRKRKLDEMQGDNEDGDTVSDSHRKLDNQQCLQCVSDRHMCLNGACQTAFEDGRKVEIYSCMGMPFQDFISFLQRHFENEDCGGILAKLEDTDSEMANSQGKNVFSLDETVVLSVNSRSYCTVDSNNTVDKCTSSCTDTITANTNTEHDTHDTSEVDHKRSVGDSKGVHEETRDIDGMKVDGWKETCSVTDSALDLKGELSLTVNDVINSILDTNVVKQIGLALINKVHKTYNDFLGFLYSSDNQSGFS